MPKDRDIDALFDRIDIGELLVAYCETLDTGQWDAYGELFTEDAVFSLHDQRRVGRDAIVAGPPRDLPKYDSVQHYSTNHLVTVEGDEARARHYVIGVHVPDSGEPSLHADAGGYYECRCVRTPAGWRFAEVQAEVLWTAGLKFELEPVEGPSS